MCVYFMCLPLILSFVIVVFTFNALLIDVAPTSPIFWLPVDLISFGEFLDGCNLCAFSFVSTAQIKCFESSVCL